MCLVTIPEYGSIRISPTQETEEAGLRKATEAPECSQPTPRTTGGAHKDLAHTGPTHTLRGRQGGAPGKCRPPGLPAPGRRLHAHVLPVRVGTAARARTLRRFRLSRAQWNRRTFTSQPDTGWPGIRACLPLVSRSAGSCHPAPVQGVFRVVNRVHRSPESFPDRFLICLAAHNSKIHGSSLYEADYQSRRAIDGTE